MKRKLAIFISLVLAVLMVYSSVGFAFSTIAVTKITLSNTKAKVVAGTSFQLTAVVVPVNATNKTLIWSSRSTSIAKVDSKGLITAVKPGSTTIFAKTKDGKITASCSLTVIKNTGSYKFDKNTRATIRFYSVDPYIKAGWHIATRDTFDMYGDFKKKFPNIKLQIVNIQANYTNPATKIVADTAAGIQIDVVHCRNGNAKWLADLGILYPLDNYVKKDPAGLSMLAPGSLELGTYNGKKWLLSLGFMSYTMYYNKKLFDKNGVQYPTDDWTLSDFRAIARKLTKHEGSSISIGYAIDGIPHWILGAAGADPIKKSNGKWLLNFEKDPGTILALETFADMVAKDKIMFTADEWRATGAPKNSYTNPAIGMQFMNSFGFDLDRGWNCVLPPQGPKGQRSTYVQSFTFGIDTGATNKDACWELLKYMASDAYLANSQAWYPGNVPVIPGSIPFNKSYFERTDWSKEQAAALKRHLDVYSYWQNIDKYDSDDLGWSMMYYGIDMGTGKRDLATTLKELTKLYNEILNGIKIQ